MTAISPSAEIEFDVHISDHPVPAAERERRLAAPGFGAVFTDHMVTMRWSAERGWHDARLEPYGPLTLDPATQVGPPTVVALLAGARPVSGASVPLV